jgi:hypothetical protein
LACSYAVAEQKKKRSARTRFYLWKTRRRGCAKAASFFKPNSERIAGTTLQINEVWIKTLRRAVHRNFVGIGWLIGIGAIAVMILFRPDQSSDYSQIVNAISIIFLMGMLLRVARKPPRGKRKRSRYRV